ncbi:DUF4336 domain-containing protein [Mesorhizobium sp. 1M-11]|uniref:DUF4336 domain-containing protein n=1 Tax=Mesorhizobium sp. 1M-11 TaxID=1529006 RepID=UPI0006C770B1|nr:DUF4336 domain-containing protein [Mesorhizobium sp. 1M-11]
MLTQFGPEIWLAEGPTITATAGFHYPTRQAVIRLFGNQLFIWSPIALTAELHASVSALGEVGYLIPPNSLHHLSLGDWQRAFPQAKTYAPPGLREKRPDILFDGDLADIGQPVWNTDVKQVVIGGNLITTEVVFFHLASRTALFCDLIQQFKPGWFSGWRAVVAGLDLMIGAEASVPRKFRIAFTDKRAARASIQKILAWPAENVLMAHGDPITRDGQAFLRRAFRWLV